MAAMSFSPYFVAILVRSLNALPDKVPRLAMLRSILLIKSIALGSLFTNWYYDSVFALNYNIILKVKND